MLRNFWNRITGQKPSEAPETVEDLQADESSIEHLGGFNPERLVEDDQPPRDDRP
jgi:hypothetical protein